MNNLQPKHIKLNEKDVDKLLGEFNISKSQIPKILSSDVSLPEGSKVGDIIKIERKYDGKIIPFFRVVV